MFEKNNDDITTLLNEITGEEYVKEQTSEKETEWSFEKDFEHTFVPSYIRYTLESAYKNLCDRYKSGELIEKVNVSFDVPQIDTNVHGRTIKCFTNDFNRYPNERLNSTIELIKRKKQFKEIKLNEWFELVDIKTHGIEVPEYFDTVQNKHIVSQYVVSGDSLWVANGYKISIHKKKSILVSSEAYILKPIKEIKPTFEKIMIRAIESQLSKRHNKLIDETIII
jgi:hypothetical protein